MNGSIDISYEDVLKAYQKKSSDLLSQLITTEARLIASDNLILELKTKIETLEGLNKKTVAKTTKSKNTVDNITDCN